MVLQLPPFYAILDPEQTRSRPVQEVLAALLEAGVSILQLRVKTLPPVDFLELAKQARALTRAHHCQLIINDRIDIALACAADGVHLGQDDLQPEAARHLLGERAIIGFSTHNPEQAREAARLPVDYIAIGPIFPTSSKDHPDPAVGLDGLRRVRQLVGTIPLVAIGGINHETAREVLDAGAASVAVISALLSEPSQITRRTQELLKYIQ